MNIVFWKTNSAVSVRVASNIFVVVAVSIAAASAKYRDLLARPLLLLLLLFSIKRYIQFDAR